MRSRKVYTIQEMLSHRRLLLVRIGFIDLALIDQVRDLCSQPRPQLLPTHTDTPAAHRRATHAISALGKEVSMSGVVCVYGVADVLCVVLCLFS